MTAPTVWVVTPVHNRRHYTEPFLECLHRQTYSRVRIVVFDDGSTDGTATMIRTRFPSVTLLQGDGNVWWTASVNRAIRRALDDAAPADCVLVMNDDVEVSPEFVDVLVRFVASHPGALVGVPSVHVRGAEIIDDGGVVINRWTAKHQVLNRGRTLSAFPPGHVERPSYLTGRACLIPVAVLRDIGLYDERHFLNCGDTELPARAARRGYALYVLYDTAIRSHVDAAAAINTAPRLRLAMLREFFFGVKSYSRLTYRLHFARTFAGPGLVQVATYLVWDVARLAFNFGRRL